MVPDMMLRAIQTDKYFSKMPNYNMKVYKVILDQQIIYILD